MMWCVKSSDGWCAVKGDYEPEEGTWTVPTECDFSVSLPWGYEQRDMPDCPDCNVALGL